MYISKAPLPTRYGTFEARAYRHRHKDFLALVKGSLEGKSGVLTRVHDACLTSEAFGSLKCDCAQQLDLALREVQEAECGIVIHLPQEGRGIGLAAKIAAYGLQASQGLDTVDANRALGLPDDLRTYGYVPPVLADLGVLSIALMTNNPMKVQALEALGVQVDEVVPCKPRLIATEARRYLDAKRRRMRHRC